MKALIYQFWEGGALSSGNQAGVDLMRIYANTIGAEYQFESDPSWPSDCRIQRKGLGRYNPHYGAFKPLFDKAYDNYDYILFCDTDVIPRKTYQHIFGEFMHMAMTSNNEIGICEEWMQPQLRQDNDIGGINSANDKRWAKVIKDFYGNEVSCDEQGRPRVFNSGCVLYSGIGRATAQKVLPDFKEYTDLMQRSGLPEFYKGDQNYLNAMLPMFNWGIMDYKWNSQIFYKPGTSGENRPISDYTENANFVHVQLRGADHYDMNKLKEVVNYANC
jgi:hypothetical protein